MRIFRVAIAVAISLSALAIPASADPARAAAFEPALAIAAGGHVTAEPGFSAAPGGAFNGRLSLAVGARGGAVAALVSAGAAYQAPSAYTAEWYRYRGFFGLDLALGARFRLGAIGARLGQVEASIQAGGRLARYDLSYSYFWFPFVELGVSLPIIEFGPGLVLLGGVELPVQLRADSFSAGLSAVVTLAFRPAQGGASAASARGASR